WEPGREDRAARLFEQACATYARVKGLQATDEARGAGYRMARLAGAQSPYPGIGRAAPVSVAAAGWGFDPQVGDAPLVEALAARYALERDLLLDRLQGQYLVVVADDRTGALTAAGDRMGWFPCYVTEADGIAWVSTSAMTLAAVTGARVDVEA